MRPLAVAVLLLLPAGGCSLANEETGQTQPAKQLNTSVLRPKLQRLVLQPEDLPRVFVRYQDGRQIAADQPAGARSNPARFGRNGGWLARYKRSGTPQTRGPLVIESRVDLFVRESGAADDLEAYQRELAKGSATGVAWTPVAQPRLGQESFAMTLVQRGSPSGVRFYLIAWREGELAASVSVNGFDGKLALPTALALARKQQARIAAVP